MVPFFCKFLSGRLRICTEEYGFARRNTDLHGGIWICTEEYGFARRNTEITENFLHQIPISDCRIRLTHCSRHCDFPCFYVAFSLFYLHFIFFLLYFHGADNWSMNYRHHDFAFPKLIDHKCSSKNHSSCQKQILCSYCKRNSKEKTRQSDTVNRIWQFHAEN